ncbi:SUMF1/EgtB/PvdOfamily nonheme iron enzyme [Reyranella sp. CPCC 100927]|nr:SUMF1/EgtB/PvdOfamily nonheme iron enzyme [Reyranella sp. CPCC 100927]
MLSPTQGEIMSNSAEQAGDTSSGRPTRVVAEASSPAFDRLMDDDALMPLRPGAVLNNTHRVERLLARGGMGEVYSATNLLTGDAVAVKVIRPELVSDRQMRALFLREATALRQIRHATIVAYEGVHAEADGRVYLVMDLIEGPSLAKRMAERPLTVPQVRALRHRLALGLLAAHEQNIVHRDLSPDNVVLRDGDLERATIIDFGIAKKTDGLGISVIGSSFAGKMEYASPEQMGLFGNAVDRRSDIYSLGLVLAAAALGRPLPMADTPALAVEQRKRVPDLSALPAALRPELAAMLQPDPARRLSSMREVLALDDGTVPRPRRLGRIAAAAVVALVLVAAGLIGVFRPDWVADGMSRIESMTAKPAAPKPEPQPERREAVARPVPGQTFRDCADCPEMVQLAPGSFVMGSSPEEREREGVPAVWGDAEGPPREVTIGSGYAIGRYEVSLGEFALFVHTTGHPMGDSCWRNPGFEQTYGDPVVCVTWNDAKAYAAWLSRITGKTYRLPLEVEWEYAARANTTTARYWGDDLQNVCSHANVLETVVKCTDGYTHTAPVGQFKPNAFHLHDTLGNVAEWIEDCWTPRNDGAPADSNICAVRGTRGGSWNAEPWRVRAAARSGTPPGTRSGEIGFRLVRVD